MSCRIVTTNFIRLFLPRTHSCMPDVLASKFLVPDSLMKSQLSRPCFTQRETMLQHQLLPINSILSRERCPRQIECLLRGLAYGSTVKGISLLNGSCGPHQLLVGWAKREQTTRRIQAQKKLNLAKRARRGDFKLRGPEVCYSFPGRTNFMLIV